MIWNVPVGDYLFYHADKSVKNKTHAPDKRAVFRCGLVYVKPSADVYSPFVHSLYI